MSDINQKPKPYKMFLVTAVIAAVLGVGAALAIAHMTPAAPIAQSNKVSQEQRNVTASKDVVRFEAVKDQTVLDQLIKQNKTVITKDSQYGRYVESINGLPGGTDGKFWTFYVDGTMANIGAEQYVTKGGEKVEWKFE